MFYNIGPLRKRLSTVDLLIKIAWFIDKETCRFSNVSREIVSYSQCKQKMMLFKGQASWAKMTSPGGKLKALACYPTKKSKQS